MTVESDAELRQILENARTIAVVGLSDREERPSHSIGRFLLDRGYRIIPVNPNIDQVFGIEAVDSLERIPVHVDIVDVFRRSEFTPDISREAVRIGAGCLWLQQGVLNAEAMNIAEAGGLSAVQDRCIAVAYRLLGVQAKTSS